MKKFKVPTLKEYFLAGVKLSKGEINISEEDIMEVFNFEGNEIMIIHKPEIIMAHGFSISMLYQTLIPTTLLFIIVDDNFRMLSEGTKKFFIQHELGHLRQFKKGNNLKKVSCFKRVISTMLGKVRKLELDADLYAINQVGKKQSMEALEEVINSQSFSISKKELKNRLEYIKLNTNIKEVVEYNECN